MIGSIGYPVQGNRPMREPVEISMEGSKCLLYLGSSRRSRDKQD